MTNECNDSFHYLCLLYYHVHSIPLSLIPFHISIQPNRQKVKKRKMMMMIIFIPEDQGTLQQANPKATSHLVEAKCTLAQFQTLKTKIIKIS